VGRLAIQTAAAVSMLLLLFLTHACVAGPIVKPRNDITRMTLPAGLCVGLTWVREPKLVEWEGHATLDGPGMPKHRLQGRASIQAAPDTAFLIAGRRAPSGARISPDAGWFRITAVAADGKTRSGRYRGSLQLHLRGTESKAVNEVDLEDYLAGVVGREMSLLRTPTEALKAQVVSARTYALYECINGRLRRIGEPFDLFDDERSQAYGGMDSENSTALEVVEETRGLVLFYRGSLVQTFYSSTCGGSTEPAWQVLASAQRIPPLAGVACGHCATSPHYEWRATLDKTELCERLTGRQGRVDALEVAASCKGGHALRMKFQVAGESLPRVVDANSGFRVKVGGRTIKSTLLVEIKETASGFEITGRGWGHGAGMCQYGAWELARSGRSAYDILEFYYPQSEIERAH
jgi:stage II sporulation protein D